MGSKVRRVYDAAQSPFERVLASSSAPPEQVPALQKLRSALDPFQLAKVIERKIECIYELANPRLSSPATQPLATCPRRKYNQARAQAVGKMLAARAWKSLRDSLFPTASTAKFRLHFQCLDGANQSYILKWLETAVTI